MCSCLVLPKCVHAACHKNAQVVGPREGSPLMFATIEEFCVGTFKAMLSSDSSADVRQVRAHPCSIILSSIALAQHTSIAASKCLYPHEHNF
jgi:hypothetical protein